MFPIRFYIKPIFFITLIFLVLSLIVRAFGSTQPHKLKPNLRGFVEGCEDTAYNCWYGIIPGRTTLEEALKVMAKMGYPPDSAEQWEADTIFRHIGETAITVDLNHYYFPDSATEIVTNIYLLDLGNLQLFDVLAFFRTPAEITVTAYPDDIIKFPPHISVDLDGHYDPRLSQNLTKISVIQYYPPGRSVEWKGLLRRDVYCALQMEKTGINCQ